MTKRLFAVRWNMFVKAHVKEQYYLPNALVREPVFRQVWDGVRGVVIVAVAPNYSNWIRPRGLR